MSWGKNDTRFQINPRAWEINKVENENHERTHQLASHLRLQVDAAQLFGGDPHTVDLLLVVSARKPRRRIGADATEVVDGSVRNDDVLRRLHRSQAAGQHEGEDGEAISPGTGRAANVIIIRSNTLRC
jgi:hypothetical protein